MKFASFDKMDTAKPETSQLENQGKRVEQQSENQKLSPAETVDDNGRKYRTEDGGWLANNEYTLDGIEYKTDDNGSVYKCDGKYYPDDWFVLNGNLYVTDADGEVIGGDIDEDDQAGESAADQEGTQELTDEDRAKIKEETGWSDEIIDNIKNMDQYELLKKANLVEVEINGRKCLIRTDIDFDKKWPTGEVDEDGNPKYETNRERMAKGKPPLDKNGRPIYLHHLGQKVDSPLVELTEEEHKTGEYKDGKKNHSLWHDNTVPTEVHGENESNWKQEREAHWKERAEQSDGGEQ